MARVILIDDHPAVRYGLGLVLSNEQHVVAGEAGCIEEAQVLIAHPDCVPDIALLDLSLGEQNGMDLIDELRTRGIAVVVYSMHEDAALIDKALDAGANAYVSKREMADVLLEAISAVLDHGCFVSPRTRESLENRKQDQNAEDMLSEREKQILAMLGDGERNIDIASALSIGVRTVETHLSRIGIKLELDGIKAIRRYAILKKRGEQGVRGKA